MAAPSSLVSKVQDPPTFAKAQQSLLLTEHEAEVASSSIGATSGPASPATRRLLQAAGYALTGLVLVNARTGMGGREVGEFSGDSAVGTGSSSGTGGSKGKTTKGKGKGGSSANNDDAGGAEGLGSHGIRVGDVVRVEDIASGGRGTKDKSKSKGKDEKKAEGDDGNGIEGVVIRVGDRSVWVAFGSSGSGNASSASDDSPSVSDLYGKKLWMLKLANDVTYRRMRQTMSKLETMPPSGYSHLLQVLFGQTSPSPQDSIGNVEFTDPTLNDSQKEAIRFALASRDVALIHGPPGTGKTHTLIELILQFLARGQKVLVCGPSNISVDNIVERLAAKRVPVIRLGHPARLLETVLAHSLEVVTQSSEAGDIVKDVRKEIDDKFKSIKKTKAYREKRQIYADIKDLRKEYRERERQCTQNLIRASSVIAATLHGAGGYQLSGQAAQKFDVLIIDEASQALEAQCWVPLLMLKDMPGKLVLAGDHLQLPPTIVSRDADRMKKAEKNKKKEGEKDGVTEIDGLSLEITLFDRLLELHGKGIKRMLTTQYRMNEQIMAFPSEELYDNELIAADSVKHRVLPDLAYSDLSSDLSQLRIDAAQGTGDAKAHVEETEDTKHPLVFYDTQGGDFPEDTDAALPDADSRLKTLLGSDSKANTYEAAIARSHIRALIAAGVRPEDIAVITPYNAQVSLLSTTLKNDDVTSGVEIGSVDGFQGREKEVVVVTLVRSNEKGEVGFLGEKRRLNVAMTRPKRQLCVIGDSETIKKGSAFLQRWMDFLEENADLRYPDIGEYVGS